jgi:iron-sulfur cluster assembly protein
MKQAITVTPEAAVQARKLIAARGKPTAGIRVGVRTRGCSGLSYTIEYADDIKPFEEVVSVEEDESGDGFKVIIDPKAVMFLLGTTMIYQEDKFKSGFEFVNPNEKGRCGCGESFTV